MRYLVCRIDFGVWGWPPNVDPYFSFSIECEKKYFLSDQYINFEFDRDTAFLEYSWKISIVIEIPCLCWGPFPEFNWVKAAYIDDCNDDDDDDNNNPIPF